jgi:glycosyltransferase involved in cell wall biosynthesis
MDILKPLSNDLYLVTGGDGYTFFKGNKSFHTYGIRHESGANAFTRAIMYICTQLKITYRLIKLSKNTDIWIFFFGGEGLVLPILTAKLLGKKVVIASAASGIKIAQFNKDPLTRVIILLQSITYFLLDKIILYSPNLIKEWNLEKYKNKISIAHHHFLDFDKFKIKKKFDERDNLIGYIGRLSEEKGTMNFVEGIPEISKRKDAIRFLIGGDGRLRDKVEKYLEKENLNHKVKLPGWIPHDELPEYFNELRLAVLPSYTEGLPNIMLEAMACGTPVLATPVGAIPDVIKDGETGFIMEDNSPECIAKNVMRALNHSDLEEIAKNARALVEKEFTYEKAVEKYRKILNDIVQDN